MTISKFPSISQPTVAMTAIMRGGDGAGQHMQYIKAERTLKPKASETIKTIITSDKFIARTQTHTHTRTPTT